MYVCVCVCTRFIPNIADLFHDRVIVTNQREFLYSIYYLSALCRIDCWSFAPSNKSFQGYPGHLRLFTSPDCSRRKRKILFFFRPSDFIIVGPKGFVINSYQTDHFFLSFKIERVRVRTWADNGLLPDHSLLL